MTVFNLSVALSDVYLQTSWILGHRETIGLQVVPDGWCNKIKKGGRVYTVFSVKDVTIIVSRQLEFARLIKVFIMADEFRTSNQSPDWKWKEEKNCAVNIQLITVR